MNPATFISRRIIRDNPEVVSQHFHAQFVVSPATLFDYLTSPAHLQKWFGTVSRDEFVYQIEGNASGRIESCKNNSFLITWEFNGTVSYLNVEITQLSTDTAQLAAGFSTNVADIKEDFAKKYGAGATGVGWDLSLWALQRYVSGATAEPTPEDYSSFVTASAHAWAEADAESGIEADAARTQAENARLFYLGLEE